MTPNGVMRPLQIKRTLQLYRPTAAQLRVHNSPHRFNVVRFGRQAGKSTFGNNRLLDRAWKRQDSRWWYLGPTYRLGQQMYERAKFSLMRSSNAALRDKSDSELMLELLSGGRIYYLSGEKLESLPGETLDGAIVDECRDQRHMKELWERVLFSMLGTTGGGCDFLSTPNGMDYFYELNQKTLTNPNWGSFHAPSYSNPLWTKEMLSEAKETMDENLYAQEIEAEFREQGVGSCYTTFGEQNITKINPFSKEDKISPYLPILVGMDFNLSPMSWILGQYKGREIYYYDEIVQERPAFGKGPTQSAAETLLLKVKDHKPGVVLIGDASGKAGQRSAPAGQSDYDTVKQILRAGGVQVSDKTPETNPTIKDRVNTVNAACRSTSGTVGLWFHPRCTKAIKDRRKRKWKDGATSLAFGDGPGEGHISDAADYPVCVLAPIKALSTKIGLINRGF